MGRTMILYKYIHGKTEFAENPEKNKRLSYDSIAVLHPAKSIKLKVA